MHPRLLTSSAGARAVSATWSGIPDSCSCFWIGQSLAPAPEVLRRCLFPWSPFQHTYTYLVLTLKALRHLSLPGGRKGERLRGEGTESNLAGWGKRKTETRGRECDKAFTWFPENLPGPTCAHTQPDSQGPAPPISVVIHRQPLHEALRLTCLTPAWNFDFH